MVAGRHKSRVGALELGPTFNLLNLVNVSNLFDLLCILKTYLLQNELIRQRKQEGGGGKLGILVANPIIKLSFY